MMIRRAATTKVRNLIAMGWRSVLVGSLVASALCRPALAQQRVALIIANANYASAPQLANPQADGTLIHDALRQAGFDKISFLKDQDRIGMERALRDFAELSDSADVALVYFAGHGIEYNGENYLIPVDARLANDRDLELEAVKLSTVVDLSSGAQRMRIIVLDACRVPPAGMRRSASSRSIPRGLAPIEPARDSLVIYSAKAGTTATDGSGRYSPFAQSLAKRLPEPGREINMLLRQVRDDVLDLTAGVQEPFTYGSLSSQEFYFVAPPPRIAQGSVDIEAEAWALCRDARSDGPCSTYLASYPQGRFAGLAAAKRSDLQAKVGAAPSPLATVQSEAVAELGLTVALTDDRRGIRVLGVQQSGPAFGQLLVGDVITAINSSALEASASASSQLASAFAAGRIKLLVSRGPSSTLVVLRR
jgi:hypothetical protein